MSDETAKASESAKPSAVDTNEPKPTKPNPRSASRIAAVQALYQMDIAGTAVTDVIDEFTTTRFPNAQGDDPIAGADRYFFSQIVRGVIRHQRDIDPLIDRRLAAGWRLGRLDSTLRAILRSAVYELMERSEVPARVVITEYLNIAHAFFDGEEPKVVNGVLDGLSRDRRTGEFPSSGEKNGNS